MVSLRVQSEGSTKKGTYFSLGCTTKVRPTQALLDNKENNSVFYELSSMCQIHKQKSRMKKDYSYTLRSNWGIPNGLTKKTFLMNSTRFL